MSSNVPPIEPVCYPNSIRFCGGSVSGVNEDGSPGAHITWNAYHGADPPAKVVRHYLVC